MPSDKTLDLLTLLVLVIGANLLGIQVGLTW